MQHGFGLSPLLQSHILEFSSDVPFERASELLNTVLPDLEMSSSQCQRVVQHFGSLEAVEEVLNTPGFDYDEVKEEACGQDRLLYVEVDGGHIRTDDGFRETKAGRVFGHHLRYQKSSDYEGVNLRMALKQSDYLAHLGNCQDFVRRFEVLIDNHIKQTPDVQLIAITDGAEWMERWLEEKYPDAILILDFYHAAEHLANFAKQVFEVEKERTAWIDTHIQKLLEGQIDEVVNAVEKVNKEQANATISEQAHRLINYYQNNRYRMKYDQYKAKGYCIGSGAIESAISTLIQQRCKLVGQRWTNRVGPVLNIRAVFKSQKRQQLRHVISQQMGYQAAA